MIPLPIIQLAGGILMAVVLTNSSLTQINNKISQRVIVQHNEIQEEIDELVDDYLQFEEDYIDHYINENDITEELDEDDLVEIKGEAIDSYINNEKYGENVHINQQILNYMKRELPKPVREFIERAEEYKIDRGQNSVQKIMWFYLNYKNGDKFEWLRR